MYGHGPVKEQLEDITFHSKALPRLSHVHSQEATFQQVLPFPALRRSRVLIESAHGSGTQINTMQPSRSQPVPVAVSERTRCMMTNLASTRYARHYLPAIPLLVLPLRFWHELGRDKTLPQARKAISKKNFDKQHAHVPDVMASPSCRRQVARTAMGHRDCYSCRCASGFQLHWASTARIACGAMKTQ